MNRFVVDASVVVKWFVPEIHRDEAFRFLKREHTLMAPDLLLSEVGNVLWKKVRRQEITEEDGCDIIRALNRVVPLHIYNSRPMLERAFVIASTTGRTVYDGLYLALALFQNCRLVTADRRFYNALKDGPFASNLLWVEESP
jgi:predicted nucleic acid-binding protein